MLITADGRKTEDFMNKETNPIPEDEKSNGKNDNLESSTFSQEQVNEIVSKRLAEANSKAEKRLQEEVAKAVAESERQSKLSKEELEEEFRAQHEQELAERERSITLRERRADAKDALAEKNIDSSLVDFVIDLDEEKTNKNIEKLERVFNKAVELGVQAKLAGTSPEDYGEGANKAKTEVQKSPTGLRSF